MSDRRVGRKPCVVGSWGTGSPRGHRWVGTLPLLASGIAQSALEREIWPLSTSWIFSLKVGQMTQAGLLEHLKLENVSLSQQLTETQQRSIKEKERIAVQLQGIEVRAVRPGTSACWYSSGASGVGALFSRWSRFKLTNTRTSTLTLCMLTFKCLLR